jgi:polar amino acid transport system permease protein
MTSTTDPVRADRHKQKSPHEDATTKPRVHRRGALEYLAWLTCVLVTFAVARTLLTNENYQWDVVAQYFTAPTVLQGLVLTVVLTFVTMFFGTLLGMLLAVLRVSPVRPVRILAEAYITFFRGTPVLVQLIFWFNIAALYPNIAVEIGRAHV